MKALIAMSGGVDSSVAALLTKLEGYECIGCTMKLYDNEDIVMEAGKTCCSLNDIEDAASVARKLGMKHYVFNFKEEFRDTVIRDFVESYEKGMTPNPCIRCNRHMKFSKLVQRAKELGCDYVVSGHYARIEKVGDKFVLKKGLDPSKDQSYVLYEFTQDILAHTLMPLGGMNKTDIRQIAEKEGLVTAHKSDSQDICFVPDGDYAGFIEKFRGCKAEEGDFVDMDGNVIGHHKGIIHYTIGQRRGLGQGFGARAYVTDINPENNQVVLGKNEDLFKDTLTAVDFNWISGEVPKEPVRCTVRIRYSHRGAMATATPVDDKTVKVVFDEPVRAITAGQSAVLYDDDIVLGGGIII